MRSQDGPECRASVGCRRMCSDSQRAAPIAFFELIQYRIEAGEVSAICRSCLLALTPDLLPPLEFTRPDLVTREVSFVQADKLALGHVPEFLSVGLRDAILLYPGGDICRGGFAVHPPAYHLADDLLQCGLVLEPERIGLAQRLAHGGIAGRRPLIRPNEYIPQQIDLIQFINAQDRIHVDPTRHVDEGQR